MKMNLNKYTRQPISLDGPSVTCNLEISIDHIGVVFIWLELEYMQCNGVVDFKKVIVGVRYIAVCHKGYITTFHTLFYFILQNFNIIRKILA